MDKAEVKRIADFPMEIREDFCAAEGEAAPRLRLAELHRIIQWLMEATFVTGDQELKVLRAG